MEGTSSLQGLHNSPPDGVHYLLEFFGCSKEQTDSIAFWKKLLARAIMDTGITVLNKHFYRFSPHGITGYLLLSASHISIHTWPEYAYVTCDVFSCGGEAEAKGIVQNLTTTLKHERVKIKRMRRGFRVCTYAK